MCKWMCVQNDALEQYIGVSNEFASFPDARSTRSFPLLMFLGGESLHKVEVLMKIIMN